MRYQSQLIIYSFILILNISNLLWAKDEVKDKLYETYDEGFNEGVQLARYFKVLYDLKNWGINLENYYKIKKEYPVTTSIEKLNDLLNTPCNDNLLNPSPVDPWGNKYWVKCQKNNYIISSNGANIYTKNELNSIINERDFNTSIVLKNGIYIHSLK